ncbi:MAG TPA: competence/damage-inducible protein A [Bacteroidota bacterium]|nr:competence/damage-inducible protein A [Bacteroidota bacterium]
MTCEILTIGDELLIGQIINTNQAFIAEQLNLINVRVARMTTVGDEMQEILDAFAEAWQRHDIVIVTGGLGPTHDDITKKAVCTFFDTDLVQNEEVRAHVQEFMDRRKRPWSPSAEEQTMVPRKAEVIWNPLGTAPGMLFAEGDKRFIVLPGVPYEMKEMILHSVLPLVALMVHDSVIRHRTLRTTGIAESDLSAALGDIDQLLRGARLAFLPSPAGVKLRITVFDTDAASADRKVQEVEGRIREKVQKYIYGTGKEELQEALGRLLLELRKTIAVAESCTGGLILELLTSISGSSAYVDRGAVTYSNRSKTEMLGVSPGLINTHGAVSREVAEAMASGIRHTAGTDIGLSVTGIAGPTGATPEKPVGLVWVGYADSSCSLAVKHQFVGTRETIRERAAAAAMELVRRKLLV